MLQGIIDRVQSSLDSLVSRYVTRAAVAVPFVVAFGFGIAAASGWLAERYGTVTAHTTMALIFAALGLAAAGILAGRSQSNGEAATTATGTATSSETSSLGNIAESLGFADTDKTTESRRTTDRPMFDTDTILAAVASLGPTVAPAAIAPVTRALLRNLPIVVGIILIAYLIYYEMRRSPPSSTSTAADTGVAAEA